MLAAVECGGDMAERGLLDGIVGGDDDGGETASSEVTLDPAAAAAAMRAAETDPELAREAAAYFRRQAHLSDLESEHRHEHREVQLSHLKVKRFTSRLAAATQMFIILVAGVVLLGLAVMLHDAFTSRSVVVEPFDAPPALAARGLTGKVVASGLLDELTRLQTATRSSAAKRNLSSAWTGDIKIEVPETGVSIGEIDRLLKQRFGHDLHIDGDLVQTETGGLTLTVRGDGVLPKTFSGGADDLAKLTAQAAEYVYGQSQPSLYDVYLVNFGRNADAVAFAKAAYATVSAAERPYLLNQWGNGLSNLGEPPQASLALYREALKLKPDYWTAYNNVMNSTWGLGDEEGAWRVGEAMRAAAGGRPGRAPELYYQNWDILTWSLQALREELTADAVAHAGIGSSTAADGPGIADVEARMHDPAAAELQLQTMMQDASDPSVAAMAHFVRGYIASEAGDGARAAAEMEAFGAAFADPVTSSNYPGYNCWIAPAEELAGHPGKADAAIAAGGHYVDCYRFKGDLLDHRGDWAAAQKAYAAAVALAPDLPAAYFSWGAALARHGDLEGALAKLEAADRRGPHWADPLKAWGDVLARQGRWREALTRYDAALKYTPAWAALRQARATAALKAG